MMFFAEPASDGKRIVVKHNGVAYYKAWLDANKFFPAYIAACTNERCILGGEAMVGVFAALFAAPSACASIRYIAVDSIGEELTRKAEKLADELEFAIE
ncbi:MAG: hypothetical protein IKZ87_01310 [Actinomycetaceae bacterium]|nr:hypothetical protein [Actinomycetaceae bacterium]